MRNALPGDVELSQIQHRLEHNDITGEMIKTLALECQLLIHH